MPTRELNASTCLMLFVLGILFPAACLAAHAEPESKENLDNIKRGLDASEADRQRAALVLILDFGLKRLSQPEAKTGTPR